MKWNTRFQFLTEKRFTLSPTPCQIWGPHKIARWKPELELPGHELAYLTADAKNALRFSSKVLSIFLLY